MSKKYNKLLFYFITILVAFISILIHPMNIFVFTNSINYYANLLVMITFVIHLYFLLKSNFFYNIKGKVFYFFPLLLIFFLPVIGFFNSLIHTSVHFIEIGIYSLYYFISSSLILIIFTNIINEKKKIKNNLMYFLFIFLLIINFLIIINLKEFGYGLLVLNITNDMQVHINSNGIGRFFAITTIISGAIYLNTNVRTYFKLIAAIFFFYFLFLTIITEGRLNFLIIAFGIFFLIFFLIENTFKKIFLQIIILAFIILSHNQYIDYKIKRIETKRDDLLKITNDFEKYREINAEITYLKFNSNRITQNINTQNSFIGCKICPEFINNDKPNIVFEKLNNITNGRFYKWAVILYVNPKKIFGNGSNADRIILSDKILKIKYGNVNNDSASSILYMYSTSGIAGCIALLIFLLLIFTKFIEDYKKNYLKNNSAIVCAWAIIIMIIIRSLFENSYAILSVDLFVMIASLTFLNIYKKVSISQKNN
jgi:hypothetical protein